MRPAYSACRDDWFEPRDVRTVTDEVAEVLAPLIREIESGKF